MEALERWTREALALTGDAVVLVNDRGCTDPGCPIWEASISVLEPGRTRMWRLVHPRGVFTKIMVRQTVLTMPAPMPWWSGWVQCGCRFSPTRSPENGSR